MPGFSYGTVKSVNINGEEIPLIDETNTRTTLGSIQTLIFQFGIELPTPKQIGAFNKIKELFGQREDPNSNGRDAVLVNQIETEIFRIMAASFPNQSGKDLNAIQRDMYSTDVREPSCCGNF